jgi:hypothetical protein
MYINNEWGHFGIEMKIVNNRNKKSMKEIKKM